MRIKLLLLIITLSPCCIMRGQAGTLDASFGTDGITEVNVRNTFGQYVTNAVLTNDGKLLLAGWTGDPSEGYKTAFLQLNEDGTRDSSFGNNGVFLYLYEDYYHRISDFLIQPDGKKLVVGYITNNPTDPDTRKLMIHRLNEDGSPDFPFGFGGMLMIDVYEDLTGTCVALDADNNIIIGAHRRESGVDHALIFRIESNGDPDTLQLLHNIGSMTSASDSSRLSDITVLPDGKIVATGYRLDTTTGTGRDMVLLRLNADGSPDDTFGTDGYVYVDNGNDATMANDEAASMAFTADNKIVISGTSAVDATSSPNTFGYLMAKFNEDGTPDNAFGTDGRYYWGLAPDYTLTIGRTTIIQPDGKILLSGGRRPLIAGEDWDHLIVRFNSDGTPDNSFGTDAQFTVDLMSNDESPAFESITNMILLDDGRLIAGASAEAFDAGRYYAMRVFTGLELGTDHHNKPDMLVYPNPATHTLYLNPDIAAAEQYTVTDLNGRIVLNGSIGTQGIPVGDLAQGIYFLRAGSYKPAKFVKQ